MKYVHDNGRLPVPNFSAGGVATPADAALMRQLGADGVFVGSGIFKSGDPKVRAKRIVEAIKHFDNPKKVAEAQTGLGEAMVGINESEIQLLMAERGKLTDKLSIPFVTTLKIYARVTDLYAKCHSTGS